MKKDIHPKYYDNAVINCSCGTVIKTGSTQEKMEIEICSQCHPFYTGKKKMLDVTGRVDRFKKLTEKTAAKKLVRRSLGKGGSAAKKAKKPKQVTKVTAKKKSKKKK